ncbi:MAG TPA: enoyl-ACP reductase FabI [Baekduia sp.]|nr:enoyl-ACP reductase FabI [Baekduia sp.]
MGLLDGKRLLITGVLTDKSIAYSVAERAQQEGAEIVLSGFDRGLRITQRMATRLPTACDVLELDATNPEHVAAAAEDLKTRWGGLDGVLHAIAFVPADALGGNFMTAPTASALTALEISSISYKTLAAEFADLLAVDGGGSIVGLDFDASVAWPVYDWAGVTKAALESINRYVARDLGPRGIRSNLISAGPLNTMAAKSIGGFNDLAQIWPDRAPLGWDLDDPIPVADTACFLFSDWSRAISGEIIHVDGGLHALGA